MSRSRRGEDRNDSSSSNSSNWSVWGTAMGMVGGAAAIGGLTYLLTRGNTQATQPQQEETQTQTRASSARESRRTAREDRSDRGDSGSSRPAVSDYLLDLFQRAAGSSSVGPVMSFSRMSPSDRPFKKVTNLNGLLDEIYTHYIAINDNQARHHYDVFCTIFYDNLHRAMKDVDPYYRKYSSTVQFAGSHFDGLLIMKPENDFDMDIVIDLPLNLRSNPLSPEASDIVIEPKSAGFVQLRMGEQFKNLPKRDGVEWVNNRAAHEWMDERNYLLRSKFINWFKGVVDKALNKYGQSYSKPAEFWIAGQCYYVEKSESGPAVTLLVRNKSGFKLDVDLVPALKFPEDRWPITSNYRRIPPQCATPSTQGHWMVVPKPNKAPTATDHDQSRSWRIALHNQERGLIHNTNNLRQGIRLMKKLRDTQGMGKIASYYIKTLFFWEIMDNDPNYWRTSSPADIFKLMVKKLRDAVLAGRIPYFWNKDNNLIAAADKTVLLRYAAKLTALLEILDTPSEYKKVANYLLPPKELCEFQLKALELN